MNSTDYDTIYLERRNTRIPLGEEREKWYVTN
jgi:hypothetical protein